MLGDAALGRGGVCARLRSATVGAATMRSGWALPLLLVLAACALVARAARTGSNPELYADAIVPQRTHSLFSPYVDSSLQNANWDYGGDAIIDTYRYVRLTQDRRGERGYLWSRLPVQVPNFEVTAEFSVHGKSPTAHGDGFAMWLTENRMEPGPVFGSRNKFRGLGIFFDTYANRPHRYVFPRIMIMQNDGTQTYNVDDDGGDQDLASCTMQLRNTPTETRLRLTYIKNLYLQLAIQNQEWNKWETCFILNNATVPDAPYLGFSASTGDVSDAHDILHIVTNGIVYNSPNSPELLAERRRIFQEKEEVEKERNSGGWSWFGSKKGKKQASKPKSKPASKPKKAPKDRSRAPSIATTALLTIASVIKWVLIIAVIAAAVGLAYVHWQRQQRKTRRAMA